MLKKWPMLSLKNRWKCDKKDPEGKYTWFDNKSDKNLSYYDTTYYDAESEEEYRRPSRRQRPHSQERSKKAKNSQNLHIMTLILKFTETIFSNTKKHGHRPASKHITMNNFNEETYKIVNHLHRTMSQAREQSFNNSLPRRKCQQEPLYEKGNYTSR